jgi:hypothetical protein
VTAPATTRRIEKSQTEHISSLVAYDLALSCKTSKGEQRFAGISIKSDEQVTDEEAASEVAGSPRSRRDSQSTLSTCGLARGKRPG